MRILRCFLTIVLPLVIFIYITVNVVNHSTAEFDSYIYQKISQNISPDMTRIMTCITNAGSAWLLAVLSLAFFISFLLIKKTSFYGAMIIINLALTSLLNVGLKYIIHRDRPDVLKLIVVGGFSFPSGHSMASMSFYGFLIYLVHKNIKNKYKYAVVGVLTALILLVGFSRIYLGVHYASDVLAGFSLGVLWVGLFSLIVELKKRKKQVEFE